MVLFVMLTFRCAAPHGMSIGCSFFAFYTHGQGTIEFSTMLCYTVYWATNYCAKFADLETIHVDQ